MLNDEFSTLMLGSPVIKACRDLGIQNKAMCPVFC